MNDLAEAMREAAEILHEIGGYSALVDDLRYGADELEVQEPVAQSKNGQLFWCGDPTEYRGVDCDLFLAPQTPVVPEGWQLVPLEPTHQMLLASYRPEVLLPFRREMYKAMLAAAPGAGGGE